MANRSYAQPLLAAGVVGLAVTCFIATAPMEPATGRALEAAVAVGKPPPPSASVEGAAASAAPAAPELYAAGADVGRAEACQAEFARVVTENPIEFGRDRWGLDAKAKAAVDKLAVVGKACSGSKIEVQAFTDSQGNRASNTRLSLERAQAVKEYLVELGLSPDQLTAVGFGPDRPVASNRTSSGRARNRRIEFRVTRVESE